MLRNLNTAIKFCSVSLLVCVFAGNAMAADVPTAGKLLQEFEQQNRPTLPEESDFTVAPLPAPIKPIEGLVVTVKRFIFNGNTLVSDSVLEEVTLPYLNREITFTDIQKVAAAAAEVYRNLGWFAKVYIPEQEISGDTIQLQVVEARLGKVIIGESESELSSLENLEPWLTSAQPIGQPVRFGQIDRAILLLNDLPGLTFTGNLTKGSKENETDVLLTLYQETPFSGNLSAGNDGSRSTGSERLNLLAAVNNPFFFGDQLTATVSATEGSIYGRGDYNFPIGYKGLRLSANASYMKYKVVEGLTELDSKGSSATFQLSARYPLIRAQKTNLYLSTSLNYKLFDNEILGETTSDYDVSNLTLSLAANKYDQVWGGGASQASLTLVSGKVDLSGSPNQEADELTTDTDGRYTKLSASISRQQYLAPKWSLFLMLNGQIADTNLDSSERLSVGGASSVRAYPTGEASASQGLVTQVELQRQFGQNFLCAAFYDRGDVWLNKKHDFPGATSPNDFSLEGYGGYLNWYGPMGLQARATYAHRIGDNPNPSVDGSDKDGTLKEHRFWASLTWIF